MGKGIQRRSPGAVTTGVLKTRRMTLRKESDLQGVEHEAVHRAVQAAPGRARHVAASERANKMRRYLTMVSPFFFVSRLSNAAGKGPGSNAQGKSYATKLLQLTAPPSTQEENYLCGRCRWTRAGSLRGRADWLGA